MTAHPTSGPTTGSFTMYTTPWCGYCHRLRSQLDREGIERILARAARTHADALRVLAWALFSVAGSLDVAQCAYALGIDAGDVHAALTPGGAMRFLHASLYTCTQSSFMGMQMLN